MKAGQVFHLRLLPKDIVACVRVCENAGLVLEGASLSQHISYAVRVLLESARRSGAIPKEEDPFTAYSQIKARFNFPQTTKLATFKVLDHQELQGEIQDKPTDFSDAVDRLTRPPESGNSRIVRLERQIAEESAKQAADPLNDRTPDILRLNEELRAELEKERSSDT